MLDVYKDGKKQFQMTPEKRVYLASEQPQTMVAIHSLPELGSCTWCMKAPIPDTGQPIIKAFLNPLVGWIWAGLVILIFGTFVALVPSTHAGNRVSARACDAARCHGARAQGRRLMAALSDTIHFLDESCASRSCSPSPSASRSARPIRAHAITT